jgi:hypothetical protein
MCQHGAIKMSWLKLIDPISTLLDKFIPDADKRAEIAHQITTMAETNAHEIAKGQIGVNEREAAHKNLFVAGWRPFTGWVCASSLAFNYMVLPFVNLALALKGSEVSVEPLELAIMLPVLLGMLGLGTMRSTERLKGVERNI